MEDFSPNTTVSGLENKKGSFILAVLAGIGAAIVSSIVWALITYWTNAHYSLLALIVGAFIGLAIRWLAKGKGPMYGIIAVILTLIACVWGDFCSTLAYLGKEEGLGFGEALFSVDFSYFFEIAFAGVGFMTVAFYAFAAYLAYMLAVDKDPE